MTNPKGLEINKNEVIAACTGRGCPGQCWSHRPYRRSENVWQWHFVVFQWTWGVQAKSGLDDPRELFQPSRSGMLGFIVLLGSAWFVKHSEYFQGLGSVVWNVCLMPMEQAGIWLRKVPKESQGY